MCYVYIQCTFITRILRHDCSMRHSGPRCLQVVSHALSLMQWFRINAITVIYALSCRSSCEEHGLSVLIMFRVFLSPRGLQTKCNKKYRPMLTGSLASAGQLLLDGVLMHIASVFLKLMSGECVDALQLFNLKSLKIVVCHGEWY